MVVVQNFTTEGNLPNRSRNGMVFKRKTHKALSSQMPNARRSNSLRRQADAVECVRNRTCLLLSHALIKLFDTPKQRLRFELELRICFAHGRASSVFVFATHREEEFCMLLPRAARAWWHRRVGVLCRRTAIVQVLRDDFTSGKMRLP